MEVDDQQTVKKVDSSLSKNTIKSHEQGLITKECGRATHTN